MAFFLSDFKVIRPPFEATQEQSLLWLKAAHVRAEMTKGNTDERFHEKLEALMSRVCCKKESIEKRGSSIGDFSHKDWGKMELFNIVRKPEGEGWGVRALFFKETVESIFHKFYPNKSDQPPNDLIHVSCTGYNAPSGAQKLIAKHGWTKKTVVTHAYHMGCMGSIPAMRMAQGFLSVPQEKKKRVDIAHTEMCTLHVNPSLHTFEQLIAESLFADGYIKYSLSNKKKKKSFQLLALHEEIVPKSEKAMQWECEDWGMRMTLSREIPSLISGLLPSFVADLLKKAKISKSQKLKDMVFAIHPGGPKIVDQVAGVLGIPERGIEETKKVLLLYGNMSSATLPHILDKILNSSKYPSGSLVVGLAFGPGITLSGVVLKKV